MADFIMSVDSRKFSIETNNKILLIILVSASFSFTVIATASEYFFFDFLSSFEILLSDGFSGILIFKRSERTT